jgi:uncharacterized oxidoreductase
MRLTDNNIFITGASSGIGLAMAEAFHALGNTVIISGRRRALLDAVVEAHPGMFALELDITDPDSIAAAAHRLKAEHPTLNVLFNNAGVMPFDDVSRPIDDAVAEQIVATNFLGPIRMSSALIEQLKGQPSATIINTTSVLGYVPLASNAIYSATKAALHAFSLSQRFMLRNTSVKVQEIAPPWVDTDLIGTRGDPRAMPLEAFVQETLAKLAGEDPEIVVDAVLALRDNPGAREHALFHAFNEDMVANPIPV